MSKAYQCDNCLECFPGVPAKVIGGEKEICHNCDRVYRAFASVDPFVKSAKITTKQPIKHDHCGCGHHHH